jgi:hypothetical protein
VCREKDMFFRLKHMFAGKNVGVAEKHWYGENELTKQQGEFILY